MDVVALAAALNSSRKTQDCDCVQRTLGCDLWDFIDITRRSLFRKEGMMYEKGFLLERTFASTQIPIVFNPVFGLCSYDFSRQY